MRSPQTTVSRRALVVELEPETAKTLQEMLQFFGFETRVAATAQEALRICADFAPSICIVDIASPLVSGYELVKQLRAQPQLAQCKFTALSQRLGAGLSPRGVAAGFQSQLTKPVSFEALLAILVGSGSATLA